MKKTQFLSLTLLGLLLTFDGCTSSVPTDPSSIILNESQTGTRINMHIGETFQIVLESNPSTGYTWEVDTVNAAILSQVGEPLFIPYNDLAGSGGKTILTFRGVATGQTQLRLIYHRSWETDVPPSKTFEVFVSVTSA